MIIIKKIEKKSFIFYIIIEKIKDLLPDGHFIHLVKEEI